MLNKKILMVGMLGLVAIGMVGCGQKTEAPKDDVQQEQVQQAVKLDVKGTIAKIQEQITEMPLTMELSEADMSIFFNEKLPELVDEFGGLMPMMQSTTEVTVFKAKEGKVDEVKAILEERKATQMKSFERYLEDQYEIIKEAKIFTMVIMCTLFLQNQKTLKLCKKSLKTDLQLNNSI